MRNPPGPRDDWARWDAASTQPIAPPPNPYVAPPPIRRPQTARPQVPWPGGPARPPSPPHNWWRIARIAFLLALVAILVVSVLVVHRISDFGRAISTQGPFSTQTGFLSGSDRVNLLVLGYGGGDHDGAYLTDSLMVLSIVPRDGATTMISVPRDLWVQVPVNSGNYQKINTAYQDGFYNGYEGLPKGQVAGGNEAANKVSDVLGMQCAPLAHHRLLRFPRFSRFARRRRCECTDRIHRAISRQRRPKHQSRAGRSIKFKTGEQHMDGERPSSTPAPAMSLLPPARAPTSPGPLASNSDPFPPRACA